MFGVTGQITMGWKHEKKSVRGRFFVWSIAWIAGHVVGGATLGALVGGAGSLIPLKFRTLLGGVFAAMSLLWAAAEAGWVALAMPQWHRQVQRRWVLRLPAPMTAFGFGVQLGSAVLTRITTMTVYALLGCTLLAGSARAGALWMALFGLARAIVPLVAASRMDTPKAAMTCAVRFGSQEPRARLAGAAILLLTASVLGWGYGAGLFR